VTSRPTPEYGAPYLPITTPKGHSMRTTPGELATWNPADVTDWLAQLADDETTTDTEYDIASRAAASALGSGEHLDAYES
jgi:hypothetical protein